MTIAVGANRNHAGTQSLLNTFTRTMVDNFTEAAVPVQLENHVADTGQTWASLSDANDNLQINPSGTVERDASGAASDIIGYKSDTGDLVNRISIKMRNTGTPSKAAPANAGVVWRDAYMRAIISGSASLQCSIFEYIAGWQNRAVTTSSIGVPADANNWGVAIVTEANGRTVLDCTSWASDLYCSWGSISSLFPADQHVGLYVENGVNNIANAQFRELKTFASL